MSVVAEIRVAEVGRRRRSFIRDLVHRPVAIGAIVFLVVLVVSCVAAPLLAPYDPREQDLTRVLLGPTGDHLLGTDSLGRDVLSRLLYGGRRSLLSIVECVAVVLALGVPLGLAAGYLGGRTDRVLGRVAEALLAFPGIILVLVVLAVLPGNEDAAMITVAILGLPNVDRVVRAATLSVREELYIAAARVSGLSHLRIVTRHVVPRVIGPVIVQASLFAAYALIFETGLAYLGLTADPTTPTWGGMVAEASTVIQRQSWLLVPPGVLIGLTILAFGLLGDVMRDTAVMDDARAERRSKRPSPSASGRATPAALPGAVERPAPLVEVRDLSVAILGADEDIPVVDCVSFEIRPGETLGLVGESGCGKSVTALALLRLLPPSLLPIGGQVVWQGRELLTLPTREYDRLRGSTFAYVSQEAQASLDPNFRVGSQIAEVVAHHDRVPRAMARRRALELLRLVDLPNPEQAARAYGHELSGGMAQRVAMALALAGRPQLLIADEPTTALDVTVQAEILALLRRLQAETGMAILLITHNWGVVADLCDRTLVMYAGEIVEEAPSQAMFDHPLHPYTRGLLESHPSLAAADGRLTSMPGSVPAPGAWPRACRFAPRCRFASDECLAGPIPLLAPRMGRQSRCVRVEEIERRNGTGESAS